MYLKTGTALIHICIRARGEMRGGSCRRVRDSYDVGEEWRGRVREICNKS